MFRKKALAVFLTLVMAMMMFGVIATATVEMADFKFADVYTPDNKPQIGILNGFSVFADENTVVTNDIAGTAIVFGKKVSIKSKIDGDLFVFGNDVEVSGEVMGNIYAFAQSLTVTGKIQKDAFLFGETIELSDKSEFSRDLIGFAQSVYLNSKIGRNAHIACGRADIGAIIGGNLKVEAENINVLDNAQITGEMSYKTRDEIAIPGGAKIGNISYFKQIVEQKVKETFSIMKSIFKLFATLISTLLIWLFITYFAPQFGKRTLYVANKEMPRTVLAGFLALITVPIISILAMVTVFGVGIGIVLMILYFIAIYLAFGVSAYAIANVLQPKLNIKKVTNNLWFVLAVAVLIKIVSMIPIIGWLVSLGMLIIGLGILISFVFKSDTPDQDILGKTDTVTMPSVQ